ncbi:MAG TPA: response regulator [Ktedonobacteraceae bacterium]|jgi:CheY-like chemotaxis protein|nr:response regulator [Ktedonobacteraceae bacterium]
MSAFYLGKETNEGSLFMDESTFPSASNTSMTADKLILVVEDDFDLRQTILWTLKDEGHEVEEAGDGGEAVERALQRKPALVLLDMGLPVIDGYGVAARLRSHYGDRILIVTMTADGRAVEKARRIAAAGYLNKPFELDDLIAIVRRMIGDP